MKNAESALNTSYLFSEEEDKEEKEVKSVITDYSLAEKHFTAAYLYAVNHCREISRYDILPRTERGKYIREAIKNYTTLSNDLKIKWELKWHACLERQKRIKNDIVDAIRCNPRSSWDAIAEHIDQWCSAATIRRWVISRGGYHLYN